MKTLLFLVATLIPTAAYAQCANGVCTVAPRVIAVPVQVATAAVAVPVRIVQHSFVRKTVHRQRLVFRPLRALLVRRGCR